MTPKKSLKEVHEYVWCKYIDNTDVDDDLDDETALQLLEESFGRVDLSRNKDFYSYGVLLFEMAFAEPERQLAYFTRARRVLEKYREVSGEMDWEEINDRLEDIDAYLDEEGVLPQVKAAGDILLDTALDIPTFLHEHTRFANFPDGMVLVPSGSFIYGNGDEQSKELESFLVDIHPVTNADYAAFIEETGYRAPRYWEDERFNQPQQPVVGVSLNDAKKYAKWANKEILSDQQWEKAARGLDGRTYPWGEEVLGKGEHYNLDPEVGACQPIGSAPHNVTPFGCQEMAGFVWEWTKTIFETGTKIRVLKGGSWADDERFIRCAAQLPVLEREKADNVGFRCCINPE